MSAPRIVLGLEALAVIALFVLVSACAAPGGLPTPAKTLDANTLAASRTLSATPTRDTAWPAQDWWKAYGDAQLDTLVAEALDGGPSMRIADARVRKALAVAGVANAARSPQANLDASATWQRFPEHGLYPPPIAGSTRASADLGVRLAYDLDLFGRNRATYEAALDEARAAEVDRQMARLLLSASVVRAYVELQHVEAQRDVATALLRQREQLVALVHQRQVAGLDSFVEVRQAEAAVPEARERLLQLEETAQITRNRIAALLGQGPDRGLAIARPRLRAAPGALLPTAVPADLIGRRPDIVGLRWRIEAAKQGIAAARAEFYPNVNLVALVGLQSIGLPNLLQAGSTNASFGPALHLPIFEAGRVRANLAGRQADHDQAVELYNQALSAALREVADPLATFRAVAAQRREVEEGLRVAGDAYDLALLRYREGLGNYLQVLSAEAQVLGQRNLEADLGARELTASVDLARALGGGYDPQHS
jgi:NodT family efflux transporter outer membrane factor (OMF) lipoprotein